MTQYHLVGLQRSILDFGIIFDQTLKILRFQLLSGVKVGTG